METLNDLAALLTAHDDATRFLPREWPAPRTQAQIDADRTEEERVEAMFAQFETCPAREAYSGRCEC